MASTQTAANRKPEIDTRGENMIPQIGVMVGAYIFLRCLGFIFSNKSQYSSDAAKIGMVIFSVICMLITAVICLELMFGSRVPGAGGLL
jgi:hypothetical protein